MIIDLNQKTLRVLVKGIIPPVELMGSKFLGLYGRSYITKKGRLWSWFISVDQLPEKDLIDIIKFCTK